MEACLTTAVDGAKCLAGGIRATIDRVCFNGLTAVVNEHLVGFEAEKILLFDVVDFRRIAFGAIRVAMLRFDIVS